MNKIFDSKSVRISIFSLSCIFIALEAITTLMVCLCYAAINTDITDYLLKVWTPFWIMYIIFGVLSLGFFGTQIIKKYFINSNSTKSKVLSLILVILLTLILIVTAIFNNKDFVNKVVYVYMNHQHSVIISTGITSALTLVYLVGIIIAFIKCEKKTNK